MKPAIDRITEFLGRHQRKELNNPALKQAAVLILLFPKEGSLHLLLTKRTDHVEHHKGQISFPGGARDDQDADLVATALRETEEEIGLPPGAVQVLGLFDDFETPSGFAIAPVVGFVPSLPALSPSLHEVAEIIEVPLALFLDKKNERTVRMERKGKTHDVFFYDYNGHEVWGATAAMIRG
ncbi:MAG: CoA pyrophosphatase, partial [Bacteroidota bacterium]